ncbi:MAG: hypothetical protein K0S33_3213 [Bacteroidetes bacterium]|nr:hypothetical protein [Bacteroidota bacterium]
MLISGLQLTGQTLTIQISGIRNPTGSVRLAFYNNNESFKEEKALFIRTVAKTGIKNGQLSISYSDLKPGVYGIAILDDENNNQEMDYGLILPKEGFGFSDYFHTGMSRPVFTQFDFVLGTGSKTVSIRLRYL